MKNCYSALIILFSSSIFVDGILGQVDLIRIDGSRTAAQSVSIEGEFLIVDNDRQDLNGFRQIVFGKAIKPSTSRAKISLLGGGSLGATSVILSDEMFKLENVAGSISLGVDAVKQIQFKNEKLPLYSNATPKEDLDQLFVKIEGTYQTVPGIVDSMDTEKVLFLYDEDTIEFKTEDVFGLILAQGAEKQQPETNGVLALTEGSRLNCLIKSLSEDEVVAKVGDFAEVVIPREVISLIEIQSNRLAFLSDLTPESVKFHEGAVFRRELQKDRNISGGKLVLRDREKRTSRTFSKGLGTKSGMSILYSNNGFDRFVATIGMDASTDGNGVCRVKVLGDGKELFAADLTGLDVPRPLDIGISGVDDIELVIDFGNDFLDLSDHVNWCDARFVKKQGL